MSDDLTFVFKAGKAYAISQGKVIAASTDPDDLEDSLERRKVESSRKEATHIVTPNGLRGQILGRTPDLWGEEVTIRLENGRVAHLHVSDDMEFVSEQPEAAESPVVALEEQLEMDYGSDRDSLEERQQVLRSIQQEAKSLIVTGASLADESRLDDLVVTADNELHEIHDVIQHLDSEEADAYAPPAPYDHHVVEQESMGGNRGEWLDHTIDDMVAEAEGTDYEKMMDEGPEVFVSELETPALADAGTVRQMASSFIRSKTAAANDDLREKYEQIWLSRVEECRKQEVIERKQTTKKEAAQNKDEHDSLPDDMLFF